MINKKDFLLSVVVPLYNEEDGIDSLFERLLPVLKPYNYEVIIVDDGSKDTTFLQVKAYAEKDKHIKVISFIRNFGHQKALEAGYNRCKGDAIVSIDGDLQDPPEMIVDMIEAWKDGYDVVYAKREDRDDTYFKKQTAYFFYRFIDFLSDTRIPKDVGDYRLIDRKVVDFLNKLPEKKEFFRGLVAWGGFKSKEIPFKRDHRHFGTTHYPLSKMIDLALNGITAFSTKPLRLATYLGFITSGFSILVILFKLIQHALFPETAWQPGWASLFFAIVFLGGVQLITIGIIGEYISRIYLHIQSRPAYLIKETVNV